MTCLACKTRELLKLIAKFGKNFEALMEEIYACSEHDTISKEYIDSLWQEIDFKVDAEFPDEIICNCKY